MKAAAVPTVAVVWLFFGRGWAATLTGALLALWWLHRGRGQAPRAARRRVNLARIAGPAWAYSCVYCRRPAESHDHLIPHSRGGADHPRNLVPACRQCNSSKGDDTPEEWWARVGHGRPYPPYWPTTGGKR